MARFFYQRTKKVVEIPDHLADEYDRRRWYVRLPEAASVPQGTVTEVLAWVGDDPQRRQHALDAERAGKRRATLLRQLGD